MVYKEDSILRWEEKALKRKYPTCGNFSGSPEYSNTNTKENFSNFLRNFKFPWKTEVSLSPILSNFFKVVCHNHVEIIENIIITKSTHLWSIYSCSVCLLIDTCPKLLQKSQDLFQPRELQKDVKYFNPHLALEIERAPACNRPGQLKSQ